MYYCWLTNQRTAQILLSKMQRSKTKRSRIKDQGQQVYRWTHSSCLILLQSGMMKIKSLLIVFHLYSLASPFFNVPFSHEVVSLCRKESKNFLFSSHASWYRTPIFFHIAWRTKLWFFEVWLWSVSISCILFSDIDLSVSIRSIFLLMAVNSLPAVLWSWVRSSSFKT